MSTSHLTKRPLDPEGGPVGELVGALTQASGMYQATIDGIGHRDVELLLRRVTIGRIEQGSFRGGEAIAFPLFHVLRGKYPRVQDHRRMSRAKPGWDSQMHPKRIHVPQFVQRQR